jgi:WD40 repeat protein
VVEREEFNAAAHKYRAFISYAREDRSLVDDLYQRLTKWRAPGPLRKRQGKYGGPPRSLSVYMDRKSQQTGETLSSGLRDKLEQSAFLIVVCSKAGADPKSWVTREIEHFLTIASPDRIIPIIVRATPDQPLEEVFPAPLMAMGEDAPIGADMLHDGGIVPVTHKVIGGLTGFSQNEIAREQELADTAARRTARRIIAAISTLFIAATVLAITAAFQRSAQLSVQAALLAATARDQTDLSRTDDALLLALEGANIGQGVVFDYPINPEIKSQISNAMYKNKILFSLRGPELGRSLTALSDDGALAAHMTQSDGTINILDAVSGDILLALPPALAPALAAYFSPNAEFIVRLTENAVEVFSSKSGEEILKLPNNHRNPFVLFSADSSKLYLVNTDGYRFQVWDIRNAQELAAPGAFFTNYSSDHSRAVVLPEAYLWGSRERLIIDLNTGGVIASLNDGAGLLWQAGATNEKLPNEGAVDRFYGIEAGAIRFRGAFVRPKGFPRSRDNSSDHFHDRDFEKTANILSLPASEPPRPQTIQWPIGLTMFAIEAGIVVELTRATNVFGVGFKIFEINKDQPLIQEEGAFVSLSPNGDLVAYVEVGNCELMLLNIKTGREWSIREQTVKNGCDFANLRQPPYIANAVYFSDDSRYAILAFNDGLFLQQLSRDEGGAVRLDTPIQLVNEPNERISAAGFDRAGNYAYTLFGDAGARIWDPLTGDQIGKVNGQVQWIDKLGQKIATIGDDRAVRIWDIRPDNVSAVHKGAAAFSRNHRFALMSDLVNKKPNPPYIVDTTTDQVAAVLNDVTGRVLNANFYNDDRRLLTLETGDAYLKVWDVAAGARVVDARGNKKRIPLPRGAKRFSVVNDDQNILVQTSDRDWYMLDLETGQPIGSENRFRQYDITLLQTHYDLVPLVRLDLAESIIWDPIAGKVLFSIPNVVIAALAASADYDIIAVATDQDVLVFRRGTGGEYQLASRYTGHTAAVLDVSVSKSGAEIVSASADNSAHQWRVSTLEVLNIFREPDDDIWRVTLDDDEQRLITISPSGFARVWDMKKGVEIVSIPIDATTSANKWQAFMTDNNREIVVAGLKSMRKWKMPPEYKNRRAFLQAACAAAPPGATLNTPYAKERYGVTSLKGQSGDPCRHFGLLSVQYYKTKWCSAIGYGCAGESGWLRRRVSGNTPSSSRAER